MDDWPPFVIESPADDPGTRRGCDAVVFELEDYLVDNDADSPTLIRETP